MKKLLFSVALSVLMEVGCKSQIPPTSHSVILTWQAPATGCTTSNPCSYVLSRATVIGTACPATTGTAYAPLNQSSPTTALTYTDTSASGLTVCYIAQTVQGSAVSVPSNTALVVVPANPLAPSLGNPSTAINDKPVLPSDNIPLSYPEVLAKIASGSMTTLSPVKLKAR